MSETKILQPVILPVLDTAVLQEKANSYALQGALKSMEEFYTGYSSPYRKAIDEDLKTKGIGGIIDIPDIIAVLNQSLSAQVDEIANAAIAKTFVPLIKNFLVRAPAVLNFSEFLKEFIKCTESKEIDNCDLEVKQSEYSWLNIYISDGTRNYKLTFHQNHNNDKAASKTYDILSLPYDDSKYKPTMKLTVEGGTLELPFTSDILKDNFLSYIARLIIANTAITMDVTQFDEDMFPREECHCD